MIARFVSNLGSRDAASGAITSPIYPIFAELAAIMQISDSRSVKFDPRLIQYMREAWVKAN
jgi:hypothetical protein